MIMKNPLHHPYLPILMGTFGNAVRDPQKPEPEVVEAGAVGATPACELSRWGVGGWGGVCVPAESYAQGLGHSPGHIAQLVRLLSLYAKVVGSISS